MTHAQPPGARVVSPLAIVALVAALVIPPAGIVCGHLALGQIARTGQGGRGLAVAGLIIGYVVTGFAVLLLVGYLAFAAWISSLGADSTHPW